MTAPLNCENLCVRFRRHPALQPALQEVSAAFAAGCLTGIVGPNGAGKTTLLRALCGLIPPHTGTVRLMDKPLSAWPREIRARKLSYLPQGGQTDWPMRAEDVVLLGRLPHIGRFAAPTPKDLAAVAAALERADAAHFAGRHMNTLSSGERTRVLLARALATEANVLLADEPAAFLDPAHQFALMSLMRAEAGRGAAVAVTLHDLTLAARFCDRIIVLAGGCVAADGAAKTALSPDIVTRVFALAPVLSADGTLIALKEIRGALS